MSDLEWLRPMVVFAHVAEAKSFRGAARSLNLSPSYVSQMITDLERRLGQQLLYRNTRKLSLTDSGARVLTHANDIRDSFQSGLLSGNRPGDKLTGHLRVAAPSSLAAPVFAEAVNQFAELHPELSLQLWLNDAITDAVAEQIDLTIRIGDVGDDLRPARKLFDTRGVLCAAPDLVKHIDDIDALQNWLFVRTPAMPRILRLTPPDQSDPIEFVPSNSLLCNNDAMTREILQFGQAYALFPGFTIRRILDKGGLMQLLPGWRGASVGVYALYTAKRAALSNATVFVDHLQQVIAAHRQFAKRNQNETL